MYTVLELKKVHEQKCINFFDDHTTREFNDCTHLKQHSIEPIHCTERGNLERERVHKSVHVQIPKLILVYTQGEKCVLRTVIHMMYVVNIIMLLYSKTYSVRHYYYSCTCMCTNILIHTNIRKKKTPPLYTVSLSHTHTRKH